MIITKYALSNRALVKFLMAIMVIGGVISFYSMSKMEDPEIIVKQAVVVALYPGASAHEVELEVSIPIEEAIRSISEVKSVASKSMDNVTQIMVTLHETVPEKNIQQLWDILRRKVSDVSSKLPNGVSTPIVMDDFGDVYGMFYAMTADGYSETEISDYATLIKRELLNIDGIGRVSIYGVLTPTIDIEMTQSQIASLGIMPSEILLSIAGDNKPIYGGYFISGDKRLRSNISGNYNSIEDIENSVIIGHEKDIFKLGDIATIKRGFAEPTRTEMSYDGERAIGISLATRKGYDITKVGKEVTERIKTLDLPAGISMNKVFYQPDLVEEAMSVFNTNLALSILIVIVVLMFTMGWRSGVMIGVGLLITVLGSILILNLLDGTLQRVSLATFVLAMGMLVDNAIVIVDGILVDNKAGIKRPDLLINTSTKTAMPLLGATLIAILAFFPIYLSPDTTGIYVRDLFIVLSVSLILSWFLSLVQIPLMADKFLRLKINSKKNINNSEKYRAYFRKFLIYILNHKTVTILIVGSLFSLSIFGFFKMPQGFFPNMSYDQLYIEYRVDEGKTSSSVKRDLVEIEKYLHSKEQILHVTASIGATPSRYNLVRTISEQGLNYGELIVDFSSSEELESSINEIQYYLTENFPEAYVRVKRYNLMYMNYPIELMFRGSDPAILKGLVKKAEKIMTDCPMTALVTNDWAPLAPSLLVNYDQNRAIKSSISRSDIGMSLLSATEGIPIGTFYEGWHSLPIMFKTVDSNNQKNEGLDNIPIWKMFPNIGVIDKQIVKEVVVGAKDMSSVISEVTATTPLSQVTNGITLDWEEPIVRRHNSSRAIKAQCNTIEGYQAEQVRKILIPEIEKIKLPDGYSMTWLGEYDASSSAKRNLFGNLPIAIMLMVLILIALFKDFKKPMIIILCLPLSVIGIVAAILLSGKEFGFVAIVGALGLIGMMIKNGVVLIDEITRLINDGTEPFDALIEASMLRFRPVMMASFTTILGMIPLISDDMFGSIAVTIMGGLFIGTIITLVMIPLFYSLFFHIKTTGKNEN